MTGGVNPPWVTCWRIQPTPLCEQHICVVVFFGGFGLAKWKILLGHTTKTSRLGGETDKRGNISFETFRFPKKNAALGIEVRDCQMGNKHPTNGVMYPKNPRLTCTGILTKHLGGKGANGCFGVNHAHCGWNMNIDNGIDDYDAVNINHVTKPPSITSHFFASLKSHLCMQSCG